MHRLVLAAVLALSAVPAFAQTSPSPPAAPGYHATPPAVGNAARATGSVLRQTWDGTKRVARETGNAISEGWSTVEHGVRWGWHHPNGTTPPPASQTDH